MVIGWTPNDGSRPPTPGEEARRAAFVLLVLVAALCGVVGWVRFPALLWVCVPSALLAIAVLLWPSRR